VRQSLPVVWFVVPSAAPDSAPLPEAQRLQQERTPTGLLKLS
jgi:hypothetical protein